MIKFTVVMPLYNAEKWMVKAIDSVVNQTYKAWELICVDDGSSDNTYEIACSYAEKYNHKIKVIKQNNSGPAVARENAILNSSGDYIVFLDSDDFIADDYLLLIEKMTSDKPEVIIPELMSQKESGEFYSFNKKNNLIAGKKFDGKQAFRLTFPWKIHGFACYRLDVMKSYAIGENAAYTNYNADEYITRVVFLHSTQIVVSDGMYYHTANFDSLTKKPSLRKLGFLLTEKKLIELTSIHDPQFIDHVKSDSLRKLFSSFYGYKINYKKFSLDERETIFSCHINHYKFLKEESFKYVAGNEALFKNFIFKLFKSCFKTIYLVIFIKRLLS